MKHLNTQFSEKVRPWAGLGLALDCKVTIYEPPGFTSLAQLKAKIIIVVNQLDPAMVKRDVSIAYQGLDDDVDGDYIEKKQLKTLNEIVNQVWSLL